MSKSKLLMLVVVLLCSASAYAQQGQLQAGKLSVINNVNNPVKIYYSKTLPYDWKEVTFNRKERRIFGTYAEPDPRGGVKQKPAYVKLPNNQVFTVRSKYRYIIGYLGRDYTFKQQK